MYSVKSKLIASMTDMADEWAVRGRDARGCEDSRAWINAVDSVLWIHWVIVRYEGKGMTVVAQ